MKSITNVAALTEEGHAGKIYDRTGPEALTHGEMAEKLSDVDVFELGECQVFYWVRGMDDWYDAVPGDDGLFCRYLFFCSFSSSFQFPGRHGDIAIPIRQGIDPDQKAAAAK